MTGLIRGEAIKLRSTRTAIGFAIVAVALLLLVVLGSILGGNPDTVSAKRDAVSVGGAVSFVLIIFGVVGATSEYRHHTLAPAVLIAPDRARLLLARALAYAVTGAALGALLIAVGLAIGVPLLLGTTDGPNLGFSDYLTVAGGGVLSCALCAAMGVGAGALIGNQVAGVVGSLVFFFVVEPLATFVWHDLPKFTISQSSGKIGGSATDPAFPFLGSLAVLVVWAAVLLALGLIRERRREVT